MLSAASTYSIEDVESVVITLIQDAIELIQESLTKSNIHDFEDEFQSYWHRWKNIKSTMSILCRPEGPSRWMQSWHTKSDVLIADDAVELQKWIQNRYGTKTTAAKLQFQAIPLLWLPRAIHPNEFPNNVDMLFSILVEVTH